MIFQLKVKRNNSFLAIIFTLLLLFMETTTANDPVTIPEMVEIKGGNFIMGCVDGRDNFFYRRDPASTTFIFTCNTKIPLNTPNEIPSHLVDVPTFMLGKTEVTVRDFRKFVTETKYKTKLSSSDGFNETNKFDAFCDGENKNWDTPGFAQADDHPVTCVNWIDAQAYIEWLNKKTAQNYRLPSEAEWEYAVRAREHNYYTWGGGKEIACQFENIDDISYGLFFEHDPRFPCKDNYVHTSPVGFFKTNKFGLYDMGGNVAEWVEDCGSYYDIAPPDGRAINSKLCNHEGVKLDRDKEKALRIIRGGSWRGTKEISFFSYRLPLPRAASRIIMSPNYRYDFIGFRLARNK